MHFKKMVGMLIVIQSLGASAPAGVSLESIFSKEALAIMPASSKELYSKQIRNFNGDIPFIKIQMRDAIESWNKRVLEKSAPSDVASSSTKQSNTSSISLPKSTSSSIDDVRNQNKIPALKSARDITLILGASDQELHIQEYQKMHPKEVVVGLTGVVTGAKRDPLVEFGPKGLSLDFNSLESMNSLLPLSGHIGKIMFDYSTFKFAEWNKNIVTLLYRLLKPGGVLLLDNTLYTGDEPNYIDGASCRKADQKEKQYIDLPDFDNQVLQPYYYTCVIDNIQRVYLGLDELIAVLGFGKNAESTHEFNKVMAIPSHRPEILKKYNVYREAKSKLFKESQMHVNSQILQNIGFIPTQKYGKPYPTGNIHAKGRYDYIEAKKPMHLQVRENCVSK